jgi:hypothetical protein
MIVAGAILKDRIAILDKIRLSNRVQRINPPTLAVTARVAELRAAGKDIIARGRRTGFQYTRTHQGRGHRGYPCRIHTLYGRGWNR